MKKQFWIFILFVIVILPACSPITVLYGLKQNKAVSEKTIYRYSKKYHVPVADLYELDSSYYVFLHSLDTIYKAQSKNHFQPLQALYYDQSGELKSFQINCYAGGFPNLEWNRNGIMNVFPPAQQAPLDSIVPLGKQLEYLKPLSKTQAFSKESFDYIVVVYWSRFMGRQSKRLIRFVQSNEKLAGQNKVKMIYVNTDNGFPKD